ncbi:hypothetical protein [Luteipulveratus halotolerans]|uniref:Uncharacterized protein n=1 Tax=Luteipulveratus halotolerans TaxID=1631356 RepID=A0A0L6CKV4_9MICO|nr:hypothetical protein [Luteipulveratus halotolerans]KNX38387.1 hypothetical protein VV01_16535 [Luteipulveratus halotolerans]
MQIETPTGHRYSSQPPPALGPGVIPCAPTPVPLGAYDPDLPPLAPAGGDARDPGSLIAFVRNALARAA